MEESKTIECIASALAEKLDALTIAVTKSYICNKELLTDDEARLYLDVSPTYWKALVKDKAFPIYTLSSNKSFVKRCDLDNYVTRAERMLLSAMQIQQEAKVLSKKRV